MKTCLWIFLILLFYSPAKADGGPDFHLVRFELRLQNDSMVTGYYPISEYNLELDSLKNIKHPEFLLEWLEGITMSGDSIGIYTGILQYSYIEEFVIPNQKRSTSVLTDFIVLAPHDIAGYSAAIESFNYTSEIETQLSQSDTSWINTPVVRSVLISGYLCTFQILVHKSTAHTDKVIDQMLQKAKIITEDEEEHFDVDPELYELIKELEEEQVVVAGYCTC